MVQREWKKLTLRLEHGQFKSLDDAAHASCLPVAVYARSLLLGVVPPPAPPALTELSDESAELLRHLQSIVSNSSQLAQAAVALGDPFDRLTTPTGVLTQLGKMARETGLQIKSGDMSPSTAIQILQTDIDEAAQQLNELARQINYGANVGGEVWQQVLVLVKRSMSKVMTISQEEVQNDL